MTKAEVIAEIAKVLDGKAEYAGNKIEPIGKAEVQAVVEEFFTVVKEKMSEGENIYVRGFGSFVNKRRATKIGRDISKNVAIKIDEHYVPSFKPSKTFIDKIKGSDKVKLANAAGQTA